MLFAAQMFRSSGAWRLAWVVVYKHLVPPGTEDITVPTKRIACRLTILSKMANMAI